MAAVFFPVFSLFFKSFCYCQKEKEKQTFRLVGPTWSFSARLVSFRLGRGSTSSSSSWRVWSTCTAATSSIGTWSWRISSSIPKRPVEWMDFFGVCWARKTLWVALFTYSFHRRGLNRGTLDEFAFLGLFLGRFRFCGLRYPHGITQP